MTSRPSPDALGRATRRTFTVVHLRPEASSPIVGRRGAAARRLFISSAGRRPRPTRRCSRNLAAADARRSSTSSTPTASPYELADGGATIMVPRDQVYRPASQLQRRGPARPAAPTPATRCSTSRASPPREFQQQVDYQRALEGELAKTIEAIDGVDDRHRAPRDPAEGRLRRRAEPADRLGARRHRAGNDARTEPGAGDRPPGRLQRRGPRPRPGHRGRRRPARCSPTGGGAGARPPAAAATSRPPDFEDRLSASSRRRCSTGRRPGQRRRCRSPPTSTSTRPATSDDLRPAEHDARRSPSQPDTETYNGARHPRRGGVLGPDARSTDRCHRHRRRRRYNKQSATVRDNAVDKVTEQPQDARPAACNALHVAVVLDTQTAQGVDPAEIEELVAAAAGIDADRGDTIAVTSMPFDTSAAEAAAAELAERPQAAEDARRCTTLLRNGGLGRRRAPAGPGLAWCSARRRAARRARTPAVRRRAAPPGRRRPAPPLQTAPEPGRRARGAALEAADRAARTELRDELARSSSSSPTRSPRCCAAGWRSVPDERHDHRRHGRPQGRRSCWSSSARSTPPRCSPTARGARSRSSPPRSPGCARSTPSVTARRSSTSSTTWLAAPPAPAQGGLELRPRPARGVARRGQGRARSCDRLHAAAVQTAVRVPAPADPARCSRSSRTSTRRRSRWCWPTCRRTGVADPVRPRRGAAGRRRAPDRRHGPHLAGRHPSRSSGAGAQALLGAAAERAVRGRRRRAAGRHHQPRPTAPPSG